MSRFTHQVFSAEESMHLMMLCLKYEEDFPDHLVARFGEYELRDARRRQRRDDEACEPDPFGYDYQDEEDQRYYAERKARIEAQRAEEAEYYYSLFGYAIQQDELVAVLLKEGYSDDEIALY